MTRSNAIIDRLKEFDFHDMPVASLEFKSDKTVELVLHLLVYNESSKDYDKTCLSFREIKNLESSPILLPSNSKLELSNFDYEYNDGFVCHLLLLLGFGEPSLNIDLTCQTIDISPE